MSELPEWVECDDPETLAEVASLGGRVQVLDEKVDQWVDVSDENRNLAAFDLGVNRIGFQFRIPANFLDVPGLADAMPVEEVQAIAKRIMEGWYGPDWRSKPVCVRCGKPALNAAWGVEGRLCHPHHPDDGPDCYTLIRREMAS